MADQPNRHHDALLGDTWKCEISPSETPRDLDAMLAWIDELTAGLVGEQAEVSEKGEAA